MSRIHLNQIQSQLKTAIQNHQILVSRIQLQPKDMDIKTQLFKLQREIMSMSQKQKLIVEKLRREIVERTPAESQEESKEVLAKDTRTNTSPSNQSHPQSSNPSSQPSTQDSISRTSTKTSVNTPPVPESHDDDSQLSADTPQSAKGTLSPLRIPSYPSQKSYQTHVSDKARDSPSSSSSPLSNKTSTPSPKQKPESADMTSTDQSVREKELLKRKLRFMASIDLVPPDSIKEQTAKRSERKKRSTNNPNFAYGFELERRPRNFLASDYFGAKKPKVIAKPLSSTPPVVKSNSSSDSNIVKKTTTSSISSDSITEAASSCKENTFDGRLCCQCGGEGVLISCEACNDGYHPLCIPIPPTTSLDGSWTCNQCQELSHKSALSLAAVNAFIANRTGKEEEKRRLLKKSSELLQEKTNLQNRTKQLKELLAQQSLRKQELQEIKQKSKETEEKLKTLLKLVQSS